MTLQLRGHVLLGVTQSLCPECMKLVPAKIIERDGRVYFHKRCPDHGVRQDFVCSDVTHYDRMEYSVPGKVPAKFGVEPSAGCPYDCGLCSEHEQHTCIGLVEITSACNLSCPMCYAASGPQGTHLTFDECKAAIDRLVEVERRAEILQLSGGEPTIHPDFVRILKYAVDQPIDYVMINTNGIRFARDPEFVETVAQWSDRTEIYLQFDGVDDRVSRKLRGENLVDTKLQAIEALGRAGLHVTLVATLQPGVNDDQLGDIIRFAIERPWVAGISFQPATYSGRCVLPADLESRITFPDVVQGIVEQTEGMFQQHDFLPLPCAHPNCHTLTYAYRSGSTVIPLTRFIDAEQNLDLLANGISLTRERASQLISRYLSREGCGVSGCSPADLSQFANDGTAVGGAPTPTGDFAKPDSPIAHEFFDRVLKQQIGARDILRIVITSFLDAYNFDVRRLMKCCVHHVLPSGHVIPFCAYNVLYRDGHVQLPELSDVGRAEGQVGQ